MREQLEKLKPRFDEVDPKQISLNETIHELERIEQDSKNLNRKVRSIRRCLELKAFIYFVVKLLTWE